MVNLSLITNSINATVSFAIFIKVFLVYRENRGKAIADTFWDFAMVYGFLGLYFANVALFLDATNVWFIMSFVHLTLIMTTAYMAVLPLSLYNMGGARRVLLPSFFVLGIIATAIDFYFGLQTTRMPLITEINPGFLVVKADFPIFLRVLDGLASLGAGGFAAVFFTLHSRSATDPLAKKRSRIIGVGFALITLASILAFLFGASSSVAIIVIASSTAVPALFVTLWGVLYRYREVADQKPSQEQSQNA